jgi:hypothetical protein
MWQLGLTSKRQRDMNLGPMLENITNAALEFTKASGWGGGNINPR